MNSLCLCVEKEADNGEKIFKDFNNFINMKIKSNYSAKGHGGVSSLK